jgi:hypothetical protein
MATTRADDLVRATPASPCAKTTAHGPWAAAVRGPGTAQEQRTDHDRRRSGAFPLEHVGKARSQRLLAAVGHGAELENTTQVAVNLWERGSTWAGGARDPCCTSLPLLTYLVVWAARLDGPSATSSCQCSSQSFRRASLRGAALCWLAPDCTLVQRRGRDPLYAPCPNVGISDIPSRDI